eukprot:Nk52_evm5s292 gene=Nk52_evmTU5s292
MSSSSPFESSSNSSVNNVINIKEEELEEGESPGLRYNRGKAAQGSGSVSAGVNKEYKEDLEIGNRSRKATPKRSLNTMQRGIYSDSTMLSSSSNSNNRSSMQSGKPQFGLGGGMSMGGGRKSSFGKPGPKKKLVIKQFSSSPRLPANFEKETWEVLKEAVHAVHEKQRVSRSLEELYSSVENMCSHKMAKGLYENLANECLQHVKGILMFLDSTKCDGNSFLKVLDDSWRDFCNQTIMIRSIFLHLDRTYVLQTSGLKSIWDMALEQFCEEILSNREIGKKVVSGVLFLIKEEREGNVVDKGLLKSLLSMFMALHVYDEMFESQFIEATKEFYANEGSRYVNELEAADYLYRVNTRLKEESERVLHYLNHRTHFPLIQVVQSEMLSKHTALILEKGFDSLMDNMRLNDLKLMYELYDKVNATAELKGRFVSYVKAKGSSIVKDTSRDKTMVQDLLDFKGEINNILNKAFNSCETFQNGNKEAFENFINTRQNTPAELIAKFIDSKLKAGNKEATEEELDALLDKVMVLFRFVQGKDVFEAFYKKDLAKRLLLGKSASFDAEKSMLLKLKQECGGGFTAKLEGMFKDIDISKDIMVSFRQTKLRAKMGNTELNVNVLTAVNWPTYPPVELNLPAEMNQMQETFKAFYLSKHSGRRLIWQNSLGACVVKARFKSVKELQVSLFQTVVLLLFNKNKELSYSAIKEATGMEEVELLRTMLSLACGKVRVLTKKPKGRDVSPSDIFCVNEDFTNKLFRIKINQIQLKETPEENANTQEKVFQDRQYQVDAAIVRIMKTRKTLSHNNLIAELFTLLKFPVKASDLKKRIESLIDRDYLERDAENSTVYRYLA